LIGQEQAIDPRQAGKEALMTAWWLIAAVAVTLILWRAIGVAGAIWRERAHVTAHCAEMDAAAISGAMLCEQLPDGTTLLVMPSPLARPEQPEPAEMITTMREVRTR
jgi:hypothetical protein